MTDRGDDPRNHQENRDNGENASEIGEIVESLPEEVKDELVRLVGMRMEYKAPIPPPRMLQGYEEVVPGSAKQIMDDAHGQTMHRQSLEDRHVDATIANSKRGQWFGFIIAVLTIILGAGLVFADKNVEGLAVILTSLAILVGVFIAQEVRKGRQLKERREAFPQESQASPEEQSEVESST